MGTRNEDADGSALCRVRERVTELAVPDGTFAPKSVD